MYEFNPVFLAELGRYHSDLRNGETAGGKFLEYRWPNGKDIERVYFSSIGDRSPIEPVGSLRLRGLYTAIVCAEAPIWCPPTPEEVRCARNGVRIRLGLPIEPEPE